MNQTSLGTPSQQVLFVALVDTADQSNVGVNQKILAQVSALRALGLAVDYLHFEGLRMLLNEVVLHEFGNRGARWLTWSSIAQKSLTVPYGAVYLRHSLTSPAVLGFLGAMTRRGAAVCLEIPTFPYDQEFRRIPPLSVLSLFVQLDRLLRHLLKGRVAAVVTFSNQKSIWGIPTIPVRNGVDLDRLPVRSVRNKTADSLGLISVSTLAYWHGIDRLIRGMGNYYRQGGRVKIELVIVGSGAEAQELKTLAEAEGVADRVIFRGILTGSALDDAFNSADVAVGSLGRHRSGIDGIQTLKNREYCARGIPFFYSESDPDFDDRGFALRVPPNEQPMELKVILDFYRDVVAPPSDMRLFASTRFSWKAILQDVVGRWVNLP